MSISEFQLLTRHYDMLTKQVRLNHPKETGGFLGGSNGIIKAVLPVFNQALTNKQTQFAMTSEDSHRAHELFHQHKLTYYGIYHNHPSGSNRPSFQDMNRIQRYLFILTLDARETLTVTAYQAIGRIPKPVPVRLITKLPAIESEAVLDDTVTKTSANQISPSDQTTQTVSPIDFGPLPGRHTQYQRHQADEWNKNSNFTTVA